MKTKKTFLAIVAVALVLALVSSCSKTSSSLPQIATDRALPISIDSAAKLIYNFLNDPILGNIGKNYSIGGTIDTKYFKIDTAKYCGVLFWYCLNFDDTSLPNFFLSWEPITKFDSTDTIGIKRPYDSLLYRSAKIFPYKGSVDFKSVLNFIKTNNDTIRHCIKIDSGSVKKNKTSFKNFTQLTGANIKDDGTYCKYPYAYFDYKKNRTMPNFLKNTPYAVRYYFGYDPKLKANKVRVILMTINPAGMTIELKVMRDGEGGAVDSSVPPPPYN